MKTIIALEMVWMVLSVVLFVKVVMAAKAFMKERDYPVPETGAWFGRRNKVIRFLELVEENAKKQANYSLLQKQAELKAMQNQISPHFLYNTLDSIRGLALEEQAFQTTSVIEALSSMLRYSISQNGSFSTVEKELENLQNYTNILKYRLKVPFSMEMDEMFRKEDIRSYIIPKLVLQPIVENAVCHGFDGKREDNKIHLSVWQTDVHLFISIKDNGSGMETEELIECNRRLSEPFGEVQNYQVDNGEKSVGLVNISQRLRLMFGEKYGLTVYSIKHVGTEVVLMLPIVPSEEALKFYRDLP